MTLLIKTINLTKSINGIELVSNVNMNVKKGEIYGFLGPNGAGKTTIMKMLTNLTKPTEGEIELFGEKLTDSSYHLLGRMGTIIEYPIFYERLTALENLELHCEYMGYHQKKVIKDALELVHLNNIDNKKVKDFSLGMKQRLGIARALCTKPELLILDEPINGLDPIGIKEMRDLFKMLSREYGITLLVSSHILGEMELMADTIGVINHGKLMKEVTMEDVRGTQAEYIELKTSDSKLAVYVLSDRIGIKNYKLIDEYTIRIYDLSIPQQEMMKKLVMNEVHIDSVHSKQSSLEDYFLSLLNGGMAHV